MPVSPPQTAAPETATPWEKDADVNAAERGEGRFHVTHGAQHAAQLQAPAPPTPAGADHSPQAVCTSTQLPWPAAEPDSPRSEDAVSLISATTANSLPPDGTSWLAAFKRALHRLKRDVKALNFAIQAGLVLF